MLDASALLPPPPHDAAHWARVRDEVTRAVDEVPLYAGRAAPPPEATPAAVSAWLASMPTVHKRDLRRGFPRALVRRTQDLKAAMAAFQVEIIATSGTTESRLQVLWEWAWWDPQEREAMRLNARVAAIMKPGFREAVLTTPVCGAATCHIGNLSQAERTIDGMLFLNQATDPSHWSPAEVARMTEEWNALRPEGVEADPAWLAELCRRAPAPLHAPAYVTLTYEQPLRAHRRAIAAALDAPLYSLYGATEAGVLFMECEAGRLHHNARHSHIELVDVGDGLGRVLVTTLGRAWMPLVRYDLGDLVRPATQPCRCGRGPDGYLIERIEGRHDDCVTARDGALLTPAMLDDLVDAAEPQLAGWQLALAPSGPHQLRAVGSDGRAAAAALAERLGPPSVEARREAALLPESSGKYRVVQR